MNFWRAILATLLSLVCTLAVSAFVTLQTLDATLLNKNEVKSWLATSGAYERLLPTMFTNSTTVQEQTTERAGSISPDTLKNALVQTFPASFVRQSIEQVLDGTYDWLDSKHRSIQFSIDATPYKDTFAKNLSAQLEPQLATMPRCTSPSQFNSTNPTCLPPGLTVKQAADSIAIDVSNRVDIFDRPLTNKEFEGTTAAPSSQDNAIQQLPHYISLMRAWLWWLPVIALLSGILTVLLSRRQLRAAKHLAGRLTFGLAVTFVLGIVVANVGKTITLNTYTSAAPTVVTTDVMQPIVRQAAPALGNRLALISGVCGALTLAAWVTLTVLYRRRQKTQLLASEGPTSLPPPTTPSSRMNGKDNSTWPTQ